MIPQATLVVAAWNAAATIERSILSGLAQKDVAVEVVVVDDCSGDDTAAIAQAIAGRDGRLRVIRLPGNGGPAAARNAALRASRGRWIAVLDSDDFMSCDRLATLMRFAEARGADIVFDNLLEVDESGAPIEPSPFLRGSAYAQPGRWDLDRFVAGNGLNGGASLGYLKPLIRRKFLQDRAIGYDETLRNSEDYHLIAECLCQGASVWFHPSVGYRYVRRAGSISHRVHPREIEALLRADAAFEARHAASLTPPTRTLLARRRTLLADSLAAERVLRALKAREPGEAIRVIAHRPRAVGMTARRLLEAAGKRIGR